ncbi:sialate O-acetylesterase [Coraliomargarita sp. W4R53]
MPDLLSDHAVLKRDAATRIWGWGTPGSRVYCEVAEVRSMALVYPDGRWTLEVDSRDFPQESLELRLSDSLDASVVIQDVIFGDVWFCAGQSNMRRTVGESDYAAKDLPAEVNPQLRLFKIQTYASASLTDHAEGHWVICDPQTVGAFSAAAYSFGARLEEVLDKPVGLVVAAWGGTNAEVWMPIERLGRPEYQMIHDRFQEKLDRYPEAKKSFDIQFEQWAVLYKKWKREGEQGPRPRKPNPPVSHNHYAAPANLFNGMVYPITPMSLSGALWYQGESNAIEGTEHLYESLMQDLIASWRVAFRNEKLPFALIQLPNYPEVRASKHAGMRAEAWAMIRDAQRRLSEADADVSLAVTLDLAKPTEEDPLHPRHKAPMGQRAAAAILFEHYGIDAVEDYSPKILAVNKQSNYTWMIEFYFQSERLEFTDPDLRSLEVQGVDGEWLVAAAGIDGGNRLVIKHPQGLAISAVRYAYMNEPLQLIVTDKGIPIPTFLIQ